MPCHHKFQSYLNLERLDFEPTTLIVGTFNPTWPETNTAQWYYGRITGDISNHNSGNHFWAVLPRLYGKGSLKSTDAKTQWNIFCKDNKIAITDLISSISDAEFGNEERRRFLQGYSDSAIAKNFKSFEFTKIVSLLEKNPSIKNVYLTRGTGDTFWKGLWQPIKNYCILHDIRCETLMTPSDYAYYQQGKYNKLNRENQLNREDFIYMHWKQKWHQL